jgi:predicted transcriptional regulator
MYLKEHINRDLDEIEEFQFDKNNNVSSKKSMRNSFKILLKLLIILREVATDKENIIFCLLDQTKRGIVVTNISIEKCLSLYRMKLIRGLKKLIEDDLIVQHDNSGKWPKYSYEITEKGIKFVEKRIFYYSKALDLFGKRIKNIRKRNVKS